MQPAALRPSLFPQQQVARHAALTEWKVSVCLQRETSDAQQSEIKTRASQLQSSQVGSLPVHVHILKPVR